MTQKEHKSFVEAQPSAGDDGVDGDGDFADQDEEERAQQNE